ncbi:magnesium/cobalt transporter CorA [Modestobacter muralis]|uniref:Magnesium transport protein CorA n=1 Tax=Modestobacter muralis TaxID=1608614 RepID=A0A6P0H7S8_9ACTN|nr:magnesium/cobalt transporter CorA [Modestobacter muralis]NEN51720.1 magnesium/cobalt transporter CorA [Modestobacter muralis]
MTSTDSTRSRLPQVHRRPRPVGPPSLPPSEREGSDFVIDCAIYVEGQRQAPVAYDEALRAAVEKGGFVWLGLHEPTQAEFEGVAAVYGLHPLAVEDAVEAHQRPKLDSYDDSLFMVLKTARYVEHDALTATSEVVNTGEVMVFLGSHYVITVRHGDHGGLKELRQTLEGQTELLQLGPSSVLYAVTDLVVDHFVEVAEAVEDDVEELETSVFSPSRTDDTPRIYQLKRELMALRRAVQPLELPLTTLADRPNDLVPDAMRSYFRDVQDHTLRVRDQVMGLDELLSNILQAALARISVAQNDDMRRISSYAGLIAAPTLVAGVYGMNFDHMPELHWSFGYPFALLLMAALCYLLYRGFKRNGWL